ncbi:MAG: GtrA family protein [Clostridia bacterium]|nr:GtrA family protein [Clostridia bacterium]MBO7397975.1 GtrA family protein [Clostridia bacterium]MBO7503079.1 GtrA family protein [Clostridia bacterium]MBP5665185.1 GtrA family protein [Clostridia bacterium]MBP5766283.1 GtrA family protein [Clostridia bacterium]
MGFIKKILEKTILDKTFWKFVLVGVLNTIVGLGVNYLVLWLLGMNPSVSDNTAYWIASAANYVIGSILSFFLNKYFTFKSNAKSAAEVFRFILNIVVCWIIAYGTAKPFIGWLFTKQWVWPWQNVEMPKAVGYIATLLGAGLFVILNYFGQRFFAFKKDKFSDEKEPENVIPEETDSGSEDPPAEEK